MQAPPALPSRGVSGEIGITEPMPILLFDEIYRRRINNFDVMAEDG
jgi:hypothetical protein